MSSGAFWKPGAAAPGLEVGAVLDRETEAESGSSLLQYNPHANLSLQQQRLRLPIYASRLQLLYLVEKYSVTVVVGETGCGKTTQIPQYLHEAGWTAGGRVVCCTQPRRVAATSVAQRVADEMAVPLGSQVGYAIRFDDRTDPAGATRIKFMTDGLLLREMMLDPLLQKYSVIMLDEAHERSLYTDILIGLLKKVLKRRPDLRLIVSSATIDAEQFKAFFNTNTSGDPALDTAAVVSIEGRCFPVEIHYLNQPTSDYLQAALNTVLEIHREQPPGDVLVFLTGQEEIDTLVSLLEEKTLEPTARGGMMARVLGLYAALPMERQAAVFEPAPRGVRKIVVATNLAETSVTIDGIVYVVDCGFIKVKAYDARAGLETLFVTQVSQANAQQRAGRAGRSRAGKAYRLYTEHAYRHLLPPSSTPEMLRTNLAPVVLQLKAMGIDNIMSFHFLSPPPAEHMVRALELLYSLGALDESARLTKPLGETLCELPIEPYLATCLLAAGRSEYSCSEEMLAIAAMLSVQHVFGGSGGGTSGRKNADAAKRKFAVYEGDHLTLLNVFNAFERHNTGGSAAASDWCRANSINQRALVRACSIRNHLRGYLRRFDVPIVSCRGDPVKLRRCLVVGFFANAARLHSDGSYRAVRYPDQVLHIHPMSVLHNRNADWVIYHETVQTNKVYMRELSTIDPLWLSELASSFYQYKPKSEAATQKTRFEEEKSKFRSVF